VRATDAAGNTDQSPATWEWAVTSPAVPVSEIVSTPASGTGSTGATSAADSTPPALDVSARRVVTRGRIVVEVACPTEPCATTAAGRILIAGAARSFNLRPVSAHLQRGVRARLELRFSKSVSRMVRRALLKRRRIRVSLVLTARDSVGNGTTRRSTIRLRG
jgi:hypothetical protein